MHPVFAHFIDLEKSHQTLLRREAGEPPASEDEALWLAVADAFPEARDAVRGADLEDGDDPDVVEPMILLAAHTALRALEKDPRLSTALVGAKQALIEEGATPEQAEALVASLILEEAFDEDQDADRFDADFIATSLAEVPALAALTPDALEALRLRYVGVPKDPVRKAAFDALIGAAWEEGPQFINGEHLEGAVETGRRTLNKDQRPGLTQALEALLDALGAEGLVSQARKERLLRKLAEL